MTAHFRSNFHLIPLTSQATTPLLQAFRLHDLQQPLSTPSAIDPRLGCSTMSSEATFLADIVGTCRNRARSGDFSASDEGSFDDDDADNFSTATIDSAEDQSQSDHSSTRPTDDRTSVTAPALPALALPTEIVTENDTATTANVESVPHGNIPPADPGDDPPPIPRGKSLAHHYINVNRVVYCSFDLEHGGEYCGIIQISAQLFRKKIADSTVQHFIRDNQTFNRYVRPPDGAIWNEVACRATHKLHANSPEILAANPFDFVWHEFCEFISEYVSPSETPSPKLDKTT